MSTYCVCGLQLWFELYRAPTANETDMMAEILSSWFMMGRLGAFNGENLQVSLHEADDLSAFSTATAAQLLLLLPPHAHLALVPACVTL